MRMIVWRKDNIVTDRLNHYFSTWLIYCNFYSYRLFAFNISCHSVLFDCVFFIYNKCSWFINQKPLGFWLMFWGMGLYGLYPIICIQGKIDVFKFSQQESFLFFFPVGFFSLYLKCLVFTLAKLPFYITF